ncbi:MAG: rhomboid family intramembrane serine protease [Phycisphaerales bacterium]
MGIEDRHYLRTSSAAPWRSRARGFSVNTWLIAICVGIFVIDGFLPRVKVPQPYVLFPGNEHVDASRLVVGPNVETQVDVKDQRTGAIVKRIVTRRPVFDADSGRQVGVIDMREVPPIQGMLAFTTASLIFEYKFWRLIGFQFLHDHSTPMHLLFNMLGLYFFGGIVEERLGGKRYLAFYLLCGIFGALMFMLLNVLGIVGTIIWGNSFRVPFLLFHDLQTPLIGASAGVFGVIMAGAYLVPDEEVLLFYLIPMRLDRLAYGLVALSLLSLAISSPNAGGEAAHLGGAIAGAYFIRRQHHLHGFFDFAGRIDPTSRRNRARRARAKGGADQPRPTGSAASRSPGRPDAGSSRAAEVDRILDKISAHGMASLTEMERRTLNEASGR